MNYKIDWNEQWSTHCPHYIGGKAKIDLSLYGGPKKTLTLLPGPGFGDLSHPTTRLALRLMSTKVQNKTIIDIGCGSGILALSALLMGAKKAYALDIDPEALTHTRQNAEHNNLKPLIVSTLPKNLSNTLILMNMTKGDQTEVFATYPQIFSLPIISSGILKSQIKSYLQLFPKTPSNTQLTEGEWVTTYLN